MENFNEFKKAHYGVNKFQFNKCFARYLNRCNLPKKSFNTNGVGGFFL